MSNLRVGSILYGYCGGYFGRDSYTNKRVELIAADYVVVRYMDEQNKPDFYSGDIGKLEEYLVKPEDYDE